MANQNQKEWTVMFYLASDNPLAPSVVSQLKSIKNAGFHPEANVIAQFDPRTPGTPTHVFDVNLIEKLKSFGNPNIGFQGNDPFVRNLLKDKLWNGQKDRGGELIRTRLKDMLATGLAPVQYDPKRPPNDQPTNRGTSEANPKESLEAFLQFGARHYPAKHYILFVLGHGLVVGNDIFLFDEHAEEKSLSLAGLREVLTSFKESLDDDEQFELVGFHSCSVSSAEVAYELQGTANFMLASQGTAFVGSCPYRQMLIRLFNNLVHYGPNTDPEKMFRAMFNYCMYNSADFLLAGYSYDLCLCSLDPERYKGLKSALSSLSDALVKGLDNDIVKDCIQLAHLRSQSFWEESYTDLSDFCYCLREGIKRFAVQVTDEQYMPEAFKSIDEHCREIELLLGKRPTQDKPVGIVNGETQDETIDGLALIRRAEFAGPAYQYARGLSVFFPWNRPTEDSLVMKKYADYRFEDTKWRLFLEKYFKETMRKSRREEENLGNYGSVNEMLLEDIATLVYNSEGQLAAEALKHGPLDGTGDDCTCTSLKNFPRDTRPRVEKGIAASKENALPISETMVTRFE